MRIVLKEEIYNSSLGICFPAGTWLDAKNVKGEIVVIHPIHLNFSTKVENSNIKTKI